MFVIRRIENYEWIIQDSRFKITESKFIINMNINRLYIYTLLGLCAAPLAANAQVELADKQTQKVNLGYEVESSEFLTTAAATTITAEELQRTSAVSLADALYGKLLGLTAIQNTGFKGEEGTGASFNIRGVQTTGENDILIMEGIHGLNDKLTPLVKPQLIHDGMVKILGKKVIVKQFEEVLSNKKDDSLKTRKVSK